MRETTLEPSIAAQYLPNRCVVLSRENDETSFLRSEVVRMFVIRVAMNANYFKNAQARIGLIAICKNNKTVSVTSQSRLIRHKRCACFGA